MYNPDTHKTSPKQNKKQTNKHKKTKTNKTNPKKWVTQTPPQYRAWTHMLAKDKQFLLFIRHPPCYSSSVLEGIHIQGELCSNGNELAVVTIMKGTNIEPSGLTDLFCQNIIKNIYVTWIKNNVHYP